MKMSKSNWYFIITIIVMLFVAIPNWKDYIVPKSKVLSYKIEKSYNILSDDLKDDIFKLTMNDEVVNDARLTWITVINNGQISIEESDFSESIKILFKEDLKVLSAVITDTSPMDMNVNVISKKGKIEVEQLLLNPTDSFTIRVVTIGPQLELRLMTRIKGIKSITEFDSEKKPIDEIFFAYNIVGAIICGIFYAMVNKAPPGIVGGSLAPINVNVYGHILMVIIYMIAVIPIIGYFSDLLFSGSLISFMLIWMFVIVVGYIFVYLFRIDFTKSNTNETSITT